MFDEGEKELTIFIPVASGTVGARRSGVFQSRQQRWDKKGEAKRGGRELKERGRKAKAYPAVLHATANSRSDCNVRRFVDFDGTRIRRCEASLCRDRGLLCYVYVYMIFNTLYFNIIYYNFLTFFWLR